MWTHTVTVVVVFGCMIGIPLLWDIIPIMNTHQGDTISEYWRYLGHEVSAAFIFAVSILPGHFWLNGPASIPNRFGYGEGVEILGVISLTWLVFGVQKMIGFELGFWSTYFLIHAGIIVGAFVWTMPSPS